MHSGETDGDTPIDPLRESAGHWRKLAAESAELARLAVECPLRAKWDHPSAHQARANTFNRAAQALEIELRTGVWHCVCCLTPKETREQAELRKSGHCNTERMIEEEENNA